MSNDDDDSKNPALPVLNALDSIGLHDAKAKSNIDRLGPSPKLPDGNGNPLLPDPHNRSHADTVANFLRVLIFVAWLDGARSALSMASKQSIGHAREALWQLVVGAVPQASRDAMLAALATWENEPKTTRQHQRTYDTIAPTSFTEPSSKAFIGVLLKHFGLPTESLAAYVPPLTSVGPGGVFSSYRQMIDTMRVLHTADPAAITLATVRATLKSCLTQPASFEAANKMIDGPDPGEPDKADAVWRTLRDTMGALEKVTPPPFQLVAASPALVTARTTPSINVFSPAPPTPALASPSRSTSAATSRRPHCNFCTGMHFWAECGVVQGLHVAYAQSHPSMPAQGTCVVCHGVHRTDKCPEATVTAILNKQLQARRYPLTTDTRRPYSMHDLLSRDTRKTRYVRRRLFGDDAPPLSDTTLSDTTLSNTDSNLPKYDPMILSVNTDPYVPVTPPQSGGDATSTTQPHLRYQPLRVDGRVGSQRTLVTLDTGANASAVCAQFARSCGLTIRPSSSRLSGPADTTFSSVGRTSFDVSIGDSLLSVNDAFVIENLSPQHSIILGTPHLLGVPGRRLEIATSSDSDPMIRFGSSGSFTAARYTTPYANLTPVSASSGPTIPPTPATSASTSITINAIEHDANDVSLEAVCYQAVVGSTPVTIVVQGRGLLDENSIDALNFGIEFDNRVDSLRSQSLDDPDRLRDALKDVLDAMTDPPVADINVLHTPDLTSNDVLSVRELASPPAASNATTATPTVPDVCDIHVSPGASDDLVRALAATVAPFADSFGGSRRPGTLQSPPASKCQPFSLTLIPNANLTRLRAAEARFGPEQEEAIRKQIEAWLPDIIEPSNATFSSRPLAVRKKDGSWRICVDYRRVNGATLLSQYPLPRVDSTTADLARIGIRFSSFDGWSMFQSLLIGDELSKDLSSFKACGRLWRFLRCPFGWQSLPSHLQRFMDRVFRGDPRFHPYADDLTVAHPKDTDAALIADISELLHRSREQGITWRADKARLFYHSLDVLGHRITRGFVMPPHDRLDALLNIGRPDQTSDLLRLLRVVQHWSPFIPLFARLAAPLWDLTHRQGAIAWSDETIAAFDRLLTAFRSSAAIVPFDSSRPVILRTDFSKHAICWVVLQVHDGIERIVHCGGRRCVSYESEYAPPVGELLALRVAVRETPQYLTGLPTPFVWCSDNKPMVDSNASPSNVASPNATISRWLLELQAVPFVARHVAGSSPAQSLQDYISRLREWHVATPPRAPDARDLPPTSSSRPASATRLIDRLALLPEFTSLANPAQAALVWLRSLIPSTNAAALAVFPPPTSTVAATLMPIDASAAVAPTPSSGSEPLAKLDASLRAAAWRRSLETDPALRPLMQAAAADHAQRRRVPQAFLDSLGLLRVLTRAERTRVRRRGRPNRDRSLIVVPVDRRREIFAAYHDGTFGGHFSGTTSYNNAKALFFWRGMHADFTRWYNECPHCTAARAQPAAGGSGEFGTDVGKFHTVSIDCAKLTTDAAGYDHVVVIVDHCTRGFEVVPVVGCTAQVVADAFERWWLFRYGGVRIVLTDNGPEFQGAPWSRLERGYGFVHTTIAPHNPRANGIAERFIRDLKGRLTRLVDAHGADWRSHLDAAAAAIRMTVGSNGISIFEVLFGQKPLLPAAARLGSDAHVGRLHASTDDGLAARTRRTVAELVELVQTQRAKRQHDSALRIRDAEPLQQLAVGDVVSIQNLDDRHSKFSQLRRWPGPLIIVARAPWSRNARYAAYQLQRPDGSFLSMFVPGRFLKRWEGDPFVPSSPATDAEPGARPWSGILDQSALDVQHSAHSDAAAAPPSPAADSLLDRLRDADERFVADIAARRDALERQAERSNRLDDDNAEVQRRADDLRRLNIDARFASTSKDYNTQIAIYKLINNNVQLSTSSASLATHSTIPPGYSLSTILRQIRLNNQVHYIIKLNDNSIIIVSPDALSNDDIKQFSSSARAARRR